MTPEAPIWSPKDKETEEARRKAVSQFARGFQDALSELMRSYGIVGKSKFIEEPVGERTVLVEKTTYDAVDLISKHTKYPEAVREEEKLKDRYELEKLGPRDKTMPFDTYGVRAYIVMTLFTDGELDLSVSPDRSEDTTVSSSQVNSAEGFYNALNQPQIVSCFTSFRLDAKILQPPQEPQT